MVLLVSESMAHIALELAEVLGTSDLPGGVVQLLSGKKEELLNAFE